MLLFNVNSNWITDICQPGILQSARFLPNRPVFALRCASAQQRDCPPDRLGEPAHVCPFVHKCASSLPRHAAINTVLRPEAPIFLPAGALVLCLPPVTVLNPEAMVFSPGIPYLSASRNLAACHESLLPCNGATSLASSVSLPRAVSGATTECPRL